MGENRDNHNLSDKPGLNIRLEFHYISAQRHKDRLIDKLPWSDKSEKLAAFV